MEKSLREATIRILDYSGIEFLDSDHSSFVYAENVDDDGNFLDEGGDVIGMGSIVVPKFLHMLDKEFTCKDNYDGNRCGGAKGYIHGISTCFTGGRYIYRYRIHFNSDCRVTYDHWYIPEDLLEPAVPRREKHILEM